MPRFDKNTPKDVLRKQAKEDTDRIKKTVQRDSVGNEYLWNEDFGFFVSKEEINGDKKIKGIDSSVPGYWWYCPEVVGTNSKGYDIKCNATHFVFIHQDGEKLTCRKCQAEHTINIVTGE